MTNKKPDMPKTPFPAFDTRELISEYVDDYWGPNGIHAVKYNREEFKHMVAMIVERTVVRAARAATWMVETYAEGVMVGDHKLSCTMEDRILGLIGFSRTQSGS